MCLLGVIEGMEEWYEMIKIIFGRMRFKCRGSDGLNTWTKMCLRGVFERK